MNNMNIDESIITDADVIKKINEQTANSVNLIYALAMIQETLIVDIETKQRSIGGYKYNIKNRVSKIKELAVGLRGEVLNKTDEEFALALGDESEKIWDMLAEMYNKQLK